jgi:hypothetical protein
VTNTVLNLPPSVQERLTGWVRIQERRAKGPARTQGGPTITLSRQFGCEAFPVSLRLQALLNGPGGEEWQILDKSLLEQVAADEGIPMRLLSHLEDASRILEGFGFHPAGEFTHDEAFGKVADALVRVARQGHAIIVGQGGALLCRDLANCFHFRLEAQESWRVATLARHSGISQAEAEHRLRAESRRRERFIQDNLGTSPADLRLYDAVFNNERHSVEQIAAAIAAYVRSAWKG